MQDYSEFLAKKSLTTSASGLQGPFDLPEMMFPFQKDCVTWALKRGRAAIFSGTGLGKCHGVDTPILMHDGHVKMVQDVRSTDLLMGPDGKPRQVISTTRGKGPLYRVTPIKGESFVCNDAHVLSLKHTVTREITNISIIDYLQKNDKFKHCNKLWRTGIDFPAQDIPMDPYMVGLWLGDGSVNQSAITQCEAEIEVCHYLQVWGYSNGYEIRKVQGNNCVTFCFHRGTENNVKGSNEFANLIRGMFVNGEKRIQHRYLCNSRYNRLELLAGLIDTDGFHIDNCYEISTKYQGLASDICYLSRSLGFAATCVKEKKGIKSTGFEGEYYRIVISGHTDQIPVKLERKKAQPRKQKKDVLVTGFKVEPIGEGDYYGFTLDGDHLYLLGDFTVTHNTIQQLAWAREVVKAHIDNNPKVLILAPLAVAKQTVREGQKFGIQVAFVRNQDQVNMLAATGHSIFISNYEMLHQFQPDEYTGVILDESSILKAYSGKIRNQIITYFAQTPYRLACTATPAPNDYEELGNHSEFLGIMDRTEMLASFFVHDGGETQKWRLKGHAEKAFWQWVCEWAVMIRMPSDLGYPDEAFKLPSLNMSEHIVEVGKDFAYKMGNLFAQEAKTLNEQRKARRASIDDRVKKAADIVLMINPPNEILNGPLVTTLGVKTPNESWLIWCDLNDESQEITRAIPGAVEITGSDSEDVKEQRMIDFATGKIRVLVTKPKIAGFGMNWQHCHNMIFVGLSHSYEAMFQAIRRCYRFGQIHPVNVHIITSDAEGAVLENVKRKEKDFEIMCAAMLDNMRETQRKNVLSAQKTLDNYDASTMMVVPSWLI